MPRKRRQKIISVMIICALTISLFAGCNARDKDVQEEKPYVIGVVMKSGDSEYWMSIASGMERAAQDYGVVVKIVSPDSELNVKMQKKMIYDMIRDGVDVLAVSPLRSKDTEYVEAAYEKGIPVISYDTKIYDESVPYIGIDNEKVGRELAKVMADMLNGQGSVGVVNGEIEQSAHSERMEGFRDYIEKNTDISVAFVENGYSNLLMAGEEIERLLSEHPDVKGIFAVSAVTALGIADYLEGDSIKVMTVDVQQDALEAVERGELAALAAQSGYDIGYETIKYIVENKDADISPLEDKILDAEIITQKNVKEWIE